MENKKLRSLQIKGAPAVDKKMTALIGALIVIVLATSLAPTMFENVDELTNATGVPSWVPTVLVVIVGAGLVYLIWDTFMR
ncbi:MAG: hypothetical protein ACOC56_06320 [Atribacterota bacterium]